MFAGDVCPVASSDKDVSMKFELKGCMWAMRNWLKRWLLESRTHGREKWRNCLNAINTREAEYMRMKDRLVNEQYASGGVGAKIRMTVKGGCL